ncbi:MAG TPA: VWA domain-containing protein [Armatimonadota bacterium]|nr:VWA domain-containing protein [Armatimonadota bacterium]
MKTIVRACCAMALLLGLTLSPMVGQEPAAPAGEAPLIQAVFVLDTTGSMGGLIHGAKEKIWSIANMLVTGTPSPNIKMGLIAYRDRGDAYVTKLTPLSEDIDAVYADLMQFTADGGGDTPESVNQALHEAVTKMAWSEQREVYRVIFLVGDCPPHMDYADDVKYPDTCKLAAERGIIINTIQCGTHAPTTPIWQAIARSAEGTFAAVAQSGGARVVVTPHDEPLARLAAELDATRLYYGTAEEQRLGQRQAANAGVIAQTGSVTANAGRAGYITDGAALKGPAGTIDAFAKAGSKDLVNDVTSGAVMLEKLDEKLLPPDMLKMTREERTKLITDLQAKREALQQQMTDIAKQRAAFIADEEKKQGEKPADSFDQAIRAAVAKQARAFHIAY